MILLMYVLAQLLQALPAVLGLGDGVFLRQSARLLAVLWVYAVGSRVLRHTKARVILFCWHAVHLSLLLVLLVIALWEYLVGAVPFGIRASVAPVIEFLVSPMLYMAAGFLEASLCFGQKGN